MHQLWQNLRYSLRALGKNPGFTAVAVLSLALGIGANVAIFTLINALLLRDLPVPQPERLVELSVVRRGDKIPFSYPMFQELDSGQRVFSGLLGWMSYAIPNVEVNGVFARANVLAVTSKFYSELGAAPLLGRLLTSEDVHPHAGSTLQVAVIGYEFWQQRFGGAQDVLGKQVHIEGQPFTIVGVTRRWFTGLTPGEPPDVTVPVTAYPAIEAFGLDDRSRLWVRITGRLKNGVTIGQARAQLQSIWPEILLATASTQTPGLRRQTFLSMGLDVSPVRTGFARDLRVQFSRPLYLLAGIVGLILLVACVNLANLMLARAAARSQEMSVRVAIGASRGAVAGQVLTESLVLSFGGALLGLAFSYWGSHLLVFFMTEGTVSFDLRPDFRILSITLFVAVFTGILFGIAPTWHCSRQDPATVLQQGSRSVAGGAGKLGKALIIAQVALSLVLVLGASLLVRTFQELRSLDLGFGKDNLLEIILNAKPDGYQNLDVNSYHRQLIEQVSNMPGVRSVALADISIPTSPGGWGDTASPTSEDPNTGARLMANGVTIWPGFFKTLAIRLIAGRDFEATDDVRHPRLVIVSRSLAERLFVNGDAIGKHIRFGFMPDFQSLEIIGVADDARLLDLREAAPPVMYLSYLQDSQPARLGYSLYVRTQKSPEALTMTVGHEIESLGHEYPLRSATVDQMMGRFLVNERVIALLSTFFAALALLLASIGLYGLMSYGVARRAREIGVRVALGAQRRSVRWMILRETLTLTLWGIAIGIPSGLAASRLIASMLFGLSPSDLSTMATACLLLAAVAFVAGYLPARRASSIDPIRALRTE